MTVTRSHTGSWWIQSLRPFSRIRESDSSSSNAPQNASAHNIIPSASSSSSLSVRFRSSPRHLVVLLNMLLLQQLITYSYANTNTTNTTNTTTNAADSTGGVRPPCDIRCKNGGTCYYISDNASALEYESQAGRPVQRCHCPAGFGGVACEIPTEECDTTTLTCTVSKRPCEAIPGSSLGHPMFTCACYVADTIGRAGSGEDSSFTGRVCRKGYTEYCSSRYDPHAEKLYFCTNGGKCLADFLAARMAPGNTSANREYEDAGCRCNTNYYGPHCEFLKLNDDLSHLNTTTKKEDGGDATGADGHDGYGNQIESSSGGNINNGGQGSGGGGGYGASSSESNNNDEVSSARSSGSDTVGSAAYRNKSAAMFAIITFLGFLLLATVYLVIRRRHLVRRSRRRRALGGEVSRVMIVDDDDDYDDGTRRSRVLKVDDGFCDFEQIPAQLDDNSDHNGGCHDDEDDADAERIIINHDDQESGIGAARVVVNGVDGYHGWNDDDHDVSGLVQHVQDVDQDDEDESYNEDDEFFDEDNSVPAEQELVNSSDDNNNNNNSKLAVAATEPQNVINSDQTTVLLQESDDLVSKCHTADITVPASNAYSSSRDRVKYGDSSREGRGAAISYRKSSSQELFSASASSGSGDDSSEDTSIHLV